jgi:hypothetical protein
MPICKDFEISLKRSFWRPVPSSGESIGLWVVHVCFHFGVGWRT